MLTARNQRLSPTSGPLKSATEKVRRLGQMVRAAEWAFARGKLHASSREATSAQGVLAISFTCKLRLFCRNGGRGLLEQE